MPARRAAAPVAEQRASWYPEWTVDRQEGRTSTRHAFTTLIELNGKTATGFRVPAAVVEALGQGKKPKVLVSIGAHPYRSTVAVYGGDFMVPLGGANREAAGVAAGETVEVVLEPDLAERTVDVPDDLAAALDLHPSARAAVTALSCSSQRQRAESVAAAEQPETRARRIEKIIAELS